MDIQQSGSQLSGVSGPGVMFEPDVRAARNTASTSKRDPRIDVLRGRALLMIFVDHVPDNLLSLITLRNFGFSDAAEVFVLLAGFSSMLAYGRIFQRDGARSGLRRVALRVARLYLFQIGLFLTTLAVALMWTTHYHLQPTILRAIREAPVAGLAHALTLSAVPAYLDILPLYIVLMARLPARLCRPPEKAVAGTRRLSGDLAGRQSRWQFQPAELDGRPKLVLQSVRLAVPVHDRGCTGHAWFGA